MYQYVSVDRIFAKLNREGYEVTDEYAVIEQIGEALAGIGTPRLLEEAVAFIEVKNNQCSIPDYCESITQIARNNSWRPNTCTPKTVCEAANIAFQQCATCNGQTTDDMGYVVLDGMGTPLAEYDLAYYRPYFDLLGEYYGWSNSPYYQGNYTPVRLSTSSFFNTVVDPKFDGALYDNCKDEYTIIGGGKGLRFSFTTGCIAVAFKRPRRDTETGYPLVPDNFSHLQAITAYIFMVREKKDLFAKRAGADTTYKVALSDWDWYCGQASNQDKMPQGVDEYQNLLDQRSYLLPHNGRYFGWFGNLNRGEVRKYNDPAMRNTRSYIR